MSVDVGKATPSKRVRPNWWPRNMSAKVILHFECKKNIRKIGSQIQPNHIDLGHRGTFLKGDEDEQEGRWWRFIHMYSHLNLFSSLSLPLSTHPHTQKEVSFRFENSLNERKPTVRLPLPANDLIVSSITFRNESTDVRIKRHARIQMEHSNYFPFFLFVQTLERYRDYTSPSR